MNTFFRFLFTGFIVITNSAIAEPNKQSLAVSFSTADQGSIHALLGGDGTRGVVLAHGAIFNKESWEDFTKLLVAEGFRTLSLDFRGYGKSKSGTQPDALFEDILAGVRYLHQIGVNQVSVIGASMGGGAAAEAAIQSAPGEIDKLILLSAVPVKYPEQLKGKLLFIAGRSESLASVVKNQYQRAPDPKKLTLIKTNAHAQHIFKTDQAEKLNQAIIDFLVE